MGVPNGSWPPALLVGMQDCPLGERYEWGRVDLRVTGSEASTVAGISRGARRPGLEPCIRHPEVNPRPGSAWKKIGGSQGTSANTLLKIKNPEAQ